MSKKKINKAMGYSTCGRGEGAVLISHTPKKKKRNDSDQSSRLEWIALNYDPFSIFQFKSM